MILFPFLIGPDPESFGNTVENMFHVSFLVKYHQVVLSIGEKGLPVLEVAKRSRANQDEDEDNSAKSDQVKILGCFRNYIHAYRYHTYFVGTYLN